MKKTYYFLLIVSLLIFLSFPLILKAQPDTFALTVISPEKTLSQCLELPQNSVLDTLAKYQFHPLQDETGFIYSLIDYAGPTSSDPQSQFTFWSFWKLENNQYQFSKLGPANVKPDKTESYVFFFGDGNEPPEKIHFTDVCSESSEANQSQPPDQSIEEQFDITPSLDFLVKNYLTQPPARQDWAAMALGAFNQSIGINHYSTDNLLSLSRHCLALSAQKIDYPDCRNKIKEYYNNDQLGDITLINDDIFAILALASSDQAWLNDHQGTFDHILASQKADGGFGFSYQSPSDVDMTAAAIWALSLKKNRPWQAINQAQNYLENSQNPDNGFGYKKGAPSNPASSAWAALAFTTLGISHPVFDYLKNSVTPEGYWLYNDQESYQSTAFAVLALSHRVLPIVNFDVIPDQPTPDQAESNQSDDQVSDSQPTAASPQTNPNASASPPNPSPASPSLEPVQPKSSSEPMATPQQAELASQSSSPANTDAISSQTFSSGSTLNVKITCQATAQASASAGSASAQASASCQQ